jgi:glycosyltransferase involved in cell wall biosynthesis
VSIWVDGMNVRFGGGLAVLDGLGRALIEHSDDVSFVLGSDAAATLGDSVRSRTVPSPRDAGSIRRLWWQQSRLISLANRAGVGGLLGFSNVVPLFGRLRGGRLGLLVQNVAPLSDRVMNLYKGRMRARLDALRMLTIASVRRADVSFAFTQHYVKELENLVPEARVVWLPPGGAPDPSGDREGRHGCLKLPYAALPPSPYAVVLADLYRYKGIEDAIRALAKESLSAMHLVVCGSAYEADYFLRLRRLASDLQVVKRVTFTGSLRHDDALRLVNDAACLLQTSRLESLGLPVIEALSLGTPTIVAETETSREVGGESVGYYRAGDSEQLAVEITKVLAGHASPINQADQRDRFRWDRAAHLIFDEFTRG